MGKHDRSYESKVEVVAPVPARGRAYVNEDMRVNILAEISGGFSSRCCFKIARGCEVRLTGDGTRVSKFGQVDICNGVTLDIELPISKLKE